MACFNLLAIVEATLRSIFGRVFLPRKRFVLVLLELVASGRQPAWRVVLFFAGVGGLTLA